MTYVSFFSQPTTLSLSLSLSLSQRDMGALDYLSNFCSVTETKRTLLKRKRRKPLQVRGHMMKRTLSLSSFFFHFFFASEV